MALQDNTSQAVIDYWQYTMIFNEAEREHSADENTVDNPDENNGATMPLTRATMPLKSFLRRNT